MSPGRCDGRNPVARPAAAVRPAASRSGTRRRQIRPSGDEQVPPPGRDATLLAAAPIPGTGASLAVVGYVIAASAATRGTPPDRSAPPSDGAAAEVGNQATPRARRPEGTGLHLPEGTGLHLDHVQRRVCTDGHEVRLTFHEFELLAFLSSHPDAVFTRTDLAGQVWHRDLGHDGRPVPRDSRTVDVHVSRLRHKLGPRYGQCLVTEYRAGYQFRPLAP